MTLRRTKKVLRTVPDGACAWITALGIITALAGPILIHAIVQSCEPSRFHLGCVGPKEQLRVPVAMEGNGVSDTVAIRVGDDRERFAWIIRFRSIHADITIRRRAARAQIDDLPSWAGMCVGESGRDLANMGTGLAFRTQLLVAVRTGTYQSLYQFDVTTGPESILIVELPPLLPKVGLSK